MFLPQMPGTCFLSSLDDGDTQMTSPPRLLSILHTETLLPLRNTVLSTSISCSELPHGFAGPAGWSPSSLAHIHWSTTDPQLSFPACPKAKWLMVTYVFPHILSFHLECPPHHPKVQALLDSNFSSNLLSPLTHSRAHHSLHALAGRNPLLLWNPSAYFYYLPVVFITLYEIIVHFTHLSTLLVNIY